MTTPTIDTTLSDRSYSIVTTTRAKYFGVVEPNGDGVKIKDAYEFTGEVQPQDIARNYLRGMLTGDNRTVELSRSLVESVSDAIDESRVLRSYEALLPDARKRAMGVMTFKALEELLRTK